MSLSSEEVLKLMFAAIGGFISSVLFIQTLMIAPLQTAIKEQAASVSRALESQAYGNARQELIIQKLDRIERKIDGQ